MPIQQFVNIFLPSVGLNALMEVSLRIDEPDADQRYSQVTRFLAVIARQNSQAARIDWKGSVESKFGREVRNRLFRQIRKFSRKPFIGAFTRAVEAFHGHLIFAQEVRIAPGRNETRRIDFVEEFDGIVLRVSPEIGVEAFEQEPGTVVPAPLEIVGEFFQPLYPLWYLGKSSCLHQIMNCR